MSSPTDTLAPIGYFLPMLLPAFALLSLVACGDSSDTDSPVVLPPDPAAPGPWIAGTLETTMPGPDGLELPVQAWFPATDAAESLYKYDDFFAGTAREAGRPDCAEARPVVVFSHGNEGMRWQSFFLAEHLASHGWIVVAPDHVGNTIFSAEQLPRSELLVRRPLDVAATFDGAVNLLGATGGPLDGCIDASDGYAVAGHSFGGYTTLAVAGAVLDGAASAAWCQGNAGGWLCGDVAEAVGTSTRDLSDGRVWAAVPMAPAGYEALIGGLPDIAVPTLVFGGDRDTLTTMDDQVRPIHAALATEPRMLATVVDAGHYTFSDACAIVGTYPDCEPPHVAPEVAHEVVNAMTLEWLRQAHGDAVTGGWLPPEGDGRVVVE